MDRPDGGGHTVRMETRSNTAAWLSRKQTPLETAPAPYTPPAPDEIVVRNHAVAINPIDWIKQVAGDFLFSWIKYPFVLGSDSAGDVVEVGSGVTRFAVGDRVVGHAIGTDPKRNRAAEGSFQMYTVLLERMAAPIPAAMSFESASVLPLGLSTAACGLFQKDQLALDHPQVTAKPERQDRARLGRVDQRGEQRHPAGRGRRLRGHHHRLAAQLRLLHEARGEPGLRLPRRARRARRDQPRCRENVSLARSPSGTDRPRPASPSSPPARGTSGCRSRRSRSRSTSRSGRKVPVLPTVARFLAFAVSLWLKTRLRGIYSKAIFGSSLAHNEVSTAVYADFLPQALANGSFVAAPDPEVAGIGLASVQAALEIQRRGVSARKVVVSLP